MHSVQELISRRFYRTSAPLLALCFCFSLRAQQVAPDSSRNGVLIPIASTFSPGANDSEDMDRTRFSASTFVPIDSWVYPAFDRLIALGYIQTGSLAVRPYTRVECARLLAEAHVLFADRVFDDESEAAPLLNALDIEFDHESRLLQAERNVGSTMDGVYARVGGVAGTPLRDSFHFSQTIYNDFGRPYGQGVNAILGVSGHAEARLFAIYFRGEYQHAAPSPAYSASAQQAIQGFDQLTEGWILPPGSSAPPVLNFNPAGVDRFRMVEGYIALNVYNWQISAGQQSLWWGPDRTTSLILSNNAAAMPMIRIARATPAELPYVLKYLGPLRFDGFFARQGGIHYVALGQTFLLNGNQSTGINPPPYVWGANITLEPTKYIEIGLAHTVIFAGEGRPLTLRTFIHTFNKGGNHQVRDPGKRVTEFNVSYHVPFVRNRLLVYSEAMAWDNPIQGHFTERFALSPGIYLSQVPFTKHLDLRLEGAYTDLPGLPEEGYFYANAHYPQGYTNYGQVLGSWIGRQGRGGAATSTYWFSARTKTSLGYRRMVMNPVMLQGGNLSDVSGSFFFLLSPGLEFNGGLQYELWRFPVITNDARSNVSATFQIRLWNKPKS